MAKAAVVGILILLAAPAHADTWPDRWRSDRVRIGPTIYDPPPVYERPYEPPPAWQVERLQLPAPVVVVPRPEQPRSGLELNHGSDALRRQWR